MSLEDVLRQGPEWEPRQSVDAPATIRPSGGGPQGVVAYRFEVDTSSAMGDPRRVSLVPLTEADLFNSGWIKANEGQRGQMRVAVALERLISIIENRDAGNPITAQDVAQVIEGTLPDVPRRQRRTYDNASPTVTPESRAARR